MRFQVLTATHMKMAIFWVLVPRSLVQVYQHFKVACCLHHQGNDGGSKQVLLPDYTVKQPRRKPSSKQSPFSKHIHRKTFSFLGFKCNTITMIFN
jgi:hypothetical protein